MGLGVSFYVFDVIAYRDSVSPALDEFHKSGDLNAIYHLLQNPPAAAGFQDKEFRVALQDFKFYAELLSPFLPQRQSNFQEQVQWGSSTRPLRDVVEGNIAELLVRIFCLKRDGGNLIEVDVSQRALTNFLYKRSQWILEMFTMAIEPSGEPTGIPFGESTEILSPKELNRLFEELESMQVPEDPSTKEQFVTLKSVVSRARDDKACALGRVVL